MSINDAGEVLGDSQTSTAGSARSYFVWNAVDGMAEIGVTRGFSAGGGINDAGQVAATELDPPEDALPVVWTALDGKVSLPGPSDWHAEVFATDINNRGQVVGYTADYAPPQGGELVVWTLDGDADLDGVLRSIEDGAPNDGDGNADGIPDHDQPEVTSLPAGSPGAPYITLVGPTGSSLLEVEMQPTPPQAPPGLGLPLGLLAFELHGVAVGGTVTVDYLMPAGAGATAFWQWDGAAWSEFGWDGVTGAQINGDIATLTYIDGGRGDLDGVANGVIVDPLAPVTPTSMSIGSAVVVEGNSGKPRTIQFAITLTEPATTEQTVQYTIVPTGSATAPADFDSKKGTTRTLRIRPSASTGKSATTFSVTTKINPDSDVEGDETFAVVLSNPTGGFGIGTGIATGTILDDDPAAIGPVVSIGDSSIHEGDVAKTVKATNNGKLWISLSEPATSTVTVVLTVAGGSATAGTDYKLLKPKTLTFKAGQWQKPVSIPVLPEIAPEGDETVTVTLSSPSAGLSLGRSTGTLQILDDD
jgi:hypothetical protein